MDELPPPPPTEENIWDDSVASQEHGTEELPAQPLWSTIVLDVKVPRFKDRIPIEMNADDTVLKLKEKIVNHGGMLLQPLPVERIVLQSNGTHVELHDEQLLEDYALEDFPDNEIDLYIKPPPPPPPPPIPKEKLMKVMVLPMRSKEKIEVEVNTEDKVAVLRVKLEQLHQRIRFRLPTDGRYFFLHKNYPMDETMSFQLHRVQPGDTIETFDGSVAGSSDDVPPKKRVRTLLSPQSSFS